MWPEGDHIVPDVVDPEEGLHRPDAPLKTDRVASLRARLRQLDYVSWESTDARNVYVRPRFLVRDDAEARYSTAAGIEASRRIAAEAIGVGGGLALHKYKPAVTGTIPYAVPKTPRLL